MKNLTKLEILNETIAFYNADVTKRSKNKSADCSYNGVDGKHCAVGRCLLPEYHAQGETLKGNHLGILTLYMRNNKANLDEMLQEKYRGHENDFWLSLQDLHDKEELWDNAGLNADGEAFANEICVKYNLKTETNA
jgi:hypothetical protein